MTKIRDEKLLDLVGSRRYCFVIMPYKSLGLLYQHLCEVIEASTGLRCIRADDIPGAGGDLLRKINDLIEGAELIVAELSEQSPNVFYEVGYAMALGKRILVLCKAGSEVPTDLKGLERIQYLDTPMDLPQFDRELQKHLTTLVDADMQLLRAMLVAPAPSPSYVIASPLRPGARLPVTEERRTYGDFLGVRGVIHALGNLLGKEGIPELLFGQAVSEDVLKGDGNLYLIGSPLANEGTAGAMESLQIGISDPWRFDMDEATGNSALLGTRGRETWQWEADRSVAVPEKDHGIILRGPNPDYPKRQILVMAGTRSLGTGAACLAATDPVLIREIRSRLRTVDLEDKSKTIWALVSGRRDPVDNHLSADRVSIDDVGVIERPS